MFKKFLAVWHQRIYFFYLEYFTKLKKSDFRTIKSRKTPIVLVGGIYAGARSLVMMKKFFEAKGYPVHLPSEKRNYERIPVLAKRLQNKIKKIPAKKIQIVAHSMGGITTLQALQDKTTLAKTKQVITLGSPLHGCPMGSLAFWEYWNNGDYLRHNSATIKKLNSDKKVNSKIRSLRASFDEIVFPKSTSILKSAKENKQISIHGHLGLILAQKSFREISKRLV